MGSGHGFVHRCFKVVEQGQSLDIRKWQDLREEDLEPNEDQEILLVDSYHIQPMPTLPVAGHRPAKEEDASHV